MRQRQEAERLCRLSAFLSFFFASQFPSLIRLLCLLYSCVVVLGLWLAGQQSVMWVQRECKSARERERERENEERAYIINIIDFHACRSSVSLSFFLSVLSIFLFCF